MLTEVATGVSVFKTMLDMAKGIKDIGDAAARNAAVIELQEKILSAQNAQATLIEGVRELEAKMAKMEQWEAEKQRYELVSLYDGSFAYALKEAMQSVEPMHHLCSACYQNGKKSIMQGMTSSYRGHLLTCPACNLEVIKEFKYSKNVI